MTTPYKHIPANDHRNINTMSADIQRYANIHGLALAASPDFNNLCASDKANRLDNASDQITTTLYDLYPFTFMNGPDESMYDRIGRFVITPKTATDINKLDDIDQAIRDGEYEDDGYEGMY